jgi:CYTH domain-containing protein
MFTTPRAPARDSGDMGQEVERKFLVSAPPTWLGECRSEPIAQGYLAIAAGGEEVRVRRRGPRKLLTVKRGQGEERLEVEIELDDEQFEALWPLTEGRRVRKRRHYVEVDRTIEVDVYEGELEGLVTAEVEFDSTEEGDRFSPPDWLGEELTGDDRYANQQLALHGRPDHD